MPGDPKAIAERGAEIYASKFQKEYEAKYPGQFVVIDVNSGEAFVRPSPEGAIRAAQENKPEGAFHLIRIGASGVYRVAFSSGGNRGDWIFGGQR